MNEHTNQTTLHDVVRNTRALSGFVHHRIATRRRSATLGVYVAHPITGIRVSRIHGMQEEVRDALRDAGRAAGFAVVPLFPMRTTHLLSHEIGDNVYDPSAGEFSAARHFTLQNRMDAIVHSDGVLVNLALGDDDGVLRPSNGIPFDVGWARESGRPAVVVDAEGSPNRFEAHEGERVVERDLRAAAATLVAMMVERHAPDRDRVVAEILEFPDHRSAEALVELAQADARRHLSGCRAILSVMRGGRSNPNFHGQVGEVSDWIVEDLSAAERIVRRLLAG